MHFAYHIGNCLTWILMLAGVAAIDQKSDAEPRERGQNATLLAEIFSLREQLQQAVADKDLSAILAHMHAEVVITTQDGQQLSLIAGHQGLQEYLQRSLLGAEASIKSVRPDIVIDEQPILHGSETLVACGSSKEHYVMVSGGEYDLKSRWSATIVRSGDSWKIASLHISSNLFDNPIFNMARNSLYGVGGVALGLGVIAGLLLARLFRPRSG